MSNVPIYGHLTVYIMGRKWYNIYDIIREVYICGFSKRIKN